MIKLFIFILQTILTKSKKYLLILPDIIQKNSVSNNEYKV